MAPVDIDSASHSAFWVEEKLLPFELQLKMLTMEGRGGAWASPCTCARPSRASLIAGSVKNLPILSCQPAWEWGGAREELEDPQAFSPPPLTQEPPSRKILLHR